MAHLTDPSTRSDIYAWYSLSGTAGAAFGSMTCGWVVSHLHKNEGWPLVKAYRAVFYGYAAIGVVKFVLALLLSRAAELGGKEPTPPPPARAATTQNGVTQNGGDTQDGADATDTTPLLRDEPADQEATREPETPPRRRWLPEISPESVNVMVSLCFLFALDSFGSGLAPL